MLPLAVVEEIQRMLDEGEVSQRGIARKLNISRGTVGAIASGKRGIYGREQDDATPEVCCLEMPPERCDGCGAKVYKPCVLCSTRKYETRQRLLELLKARPIPSLRRVA